MRSNKHWTMDEVHQLGCLVADGHSNRDIAGILKRTPQAIANKKIELRDPDYYRRRDMAEEPETTAINPEADGLILRITLWSWAGALALAAVYALAGGW